MAHRRFSNPSRQVRVAFAAGLLVSALALPANASSLPTALGCIFSLTAKHHDWTTTPVNRWSPVVHVTEDLKGAMLDPATTGGPAFEKPRCFDTAYTAIVHDRTGRPYLGSPRLDGKTVPAAASFEHDWASISPLPSGNLGAFSADASRSSDALVEPRRWWARTWERVRNRPTDTARGPNRFPALVLDRTGGMSRDDRVFYFRYSIVRLSPDTDEATGRSLCRWLGLKGRPGIVLRRAFTSDESRQLGELVGPAYVETERLRSMVSPNAAAEWEKRRRVRELRAFRMVEIPPTPGPGLLLTGPEAPYLPESAMLAQRTTIVGVGNDGAHYAYDAESQALVEIIPPAASGTARWTFRRVDDGRTLRDVSTEEAKALLPKLWFATDFLDYYFGT